MKISNLMKAVACLLIMVSFGAAKAEDGRRDGGDQAMKRMQYMMQQLSKEKAQLEKKNSIQLKEIEVLTEKLVAAESDLARFKKKSSKLEKNVAVKKRTIAKREDQLRKLAGKYKDAAILVRQLNRNKNDLLASVEQKDNFIGDLQEKNFRLFEVNQDLLKLYENKSAWDSLTQREPVTGLRQVEIENLVQEYRFRLEDNRAELESSAITEK